MGVADLTPRPAPGKTSLYTVLLLQGDGGTGVTYHRSPSSGQACEPGEPLQSLFYERNLSAGSLRLACLYSLRIY